MAARFSRLKVLVGNVMCHRYVGSLLRKFSSGFLRTGGYRFFVESELVTSEICASLYFGLYERSEVSLIRRFLPRGVDVVELGSSLGVVTVNAIGATGGRARIVAVEANPALVQLIETNVKENFPTRDVTVVSRAVDYNDNDTTAFSVSRDNLGSRVSDVVTGGNTLVRVECVTLAELLAQYNIESFSLVSDIEGAEAGLFLREKDVLQARCHIIIAEVHDTNWNDRLYLADEVADLIRAIPGFRQIARRNNVYVFENTAFATYR